MILFVCRPFSSRGTFTSHFIRSNKSMYPHFPGDDWKVDTRLVVLVPRQHSPITYLLQLRTLSTRKPKTIYPPCRYCLLRRHQQIEMRKKQSSLLSPWTNCSANSTDIQQTLIFYTRDILQQALPNYISQHCSKRSFVARDLVKERSGSTSIS
jgi:hypothetical protein